MAREKYPFNAWKKLRDADAGLSADDLTAPSEVTASSAELNLLDGLSVAGNATASKPLVLDANKAALGLRRKVTADADGMSGIGEAYSGGIFTNEGATGAAVFALGPLVGMVFSS